MIEAEVERNGEVIMQRTYYEPSLSLEMVLKQLELYIRAEQIHKAGECTMKVRFARLKAEQEGEVQA